MTAPASPRPLYRVRQFWRALHARPTAQELAAAQGVLTPQQYALFCRMQPSEQAHSLGVLRQLHAQALPPQDLQVAALLHDAGKCLAAFLAAPACRGLPAPGMGRSACRSSRRLPPGGGSDPAPPGET